MKNSSLCYLERDGQYLMLHRTKKKNDANGGKWIGVGGSFEEGERPDEWAARESFEETGLAVGRLEYRGIVTFVSDEWETEYMHLFTSSEFDGSVRDCDEGDLAWIPKKDVFALELWEGDRVFLKLLDDGVPFFSLKLVYEKDKLVRAVLDGRRLDIPKV